MSSSPTSAALATIPKRCRHCASTLGVICGLLFSLGFIWPASADVPLAERAVSGHFPVDFVRAGVFASAPSPLLQNFLGPVDAWGRRVLAKRQSTLTPAQLRRYYGATPPPTDRRGRSTEPVENSAAEWDVSALLTAP